MTAPYNPFETPRAELGLASSTDPYAIEDERLRRALLNHEVSIQAVGRLMRQLGRDRQVMAVTHLAQVAICADHHLVVSKHLRGESTLSTVALALGDTRISEIARMLGGDRVLASTLAHARELLELQQ